MAASTRGEAGRRAEALAAAFLAARGLAIVERNFRCRRGEIDIIARDGASAGVRRSASALAARFRRRRRQHHARSSARGWPPPRRSTSRASRARRRAASMPCCSTRSSPVASNGCATSWTRERAGPSQARNRSAKREGSARRAVPSANTRSGREGASTIVVTIEDRPHLPRHGPYSAHPCAFHRQRAIEARGGRRACPGACPRCGSARRVPSPRRQDPRLRQWRIGGRRPALCGRDDRPLRAGAPGAAGHFARDGHVDSHRRGERLLVRAGLREAGARPGRQRRRAARSFDLRQFRQHRRRDQCGARTRYAGGGPHRQGRRSGRRDARRRPTSTCASRTSGRRASRRSTC